ncbi:HOP1 [Auxenochlorella protothecoides x Auxenochlorella symbiontica]
MSSDELKAQGNAAFSAGKFVEAADLFSQAIAVDPGNHVLYSNKSAALASLSKYDEALEAAEKVVALKPDWPKGYSRLGAAHFGLRAFQAASDAYSKGLGLDPTNEQLKQGLEDSKAALARPAPSSGIFTSPEVLGRLATNPTTRAFLGQPDFMQRLQEINRNPQAMSNYLTDNRLQQALQVGLGLNFGSAEEGSATSTSAHAGFGPEPMEEDAAPASASGAAPPPEASSRPGSAPAPAPQPEEPEGEDEVAAARRAALAEKEAGNAAYKARDFDTAIAKYSRAIELDDSDVSFLSNRAAAYFEQGSYDECIADCDTAIARGREVRADYKLMARAMARKGNALAKKGELEEAVAVYQKSLTEHRTADTLKRLNETEKLLKQRVETAYIDLELSAKAKDEGNEAFKAQKYPEAVKFYTEALKRGPASVNEEAYKLYSNRAACYTKLGAWSEGLKDAEECIRLKPDFSKGYSRKGHLQFFMKEYAKARATYEEGLTHDPHSAELKEGLIRTIQAINKMTRGEGTDAERKQQQERAMADPEIQAILTDPVMRQVLRDMEENPAAAQKHLANVQVAAKFEKLVEAGIVQIR